MLHLMINIAPIDTHTHTTHNINIDTHTHTHIIIYCNTSLFQEDVASLAEEEYDQNVHNFNEPSILIQPKKK